MIIRIKAGGARRPRATATRSPELDRVLSERMVDKVDSVPATEAVHSGVRSAARRLSADSRG
jgi:hypothetical protein